MGRARPQHVTQSFALCRVLRAGLDRYIWVRCWEHTESVGNHEGQCQTWCTLDAVRQPVEFVVPDTSCCVGIVISARVFAFSCGAFLGKY